MSEEFLLYVCSSTAFKLMEPLAVTSILKLNQKRYSSVEVCFIVKSVVRLQQTLQRKMESQPQPPQTATPAFVPLFDNGGGGGPTRSAPMSLGHLQSHRSNLEQLRNGSAATSSHPPNRTGLRPSEHGTSSSSPEGKSMPNSTPQGRQHHHAAAGQQVDVDEVERRMFADQATALRRSGREKEAASDVFDREYDEVMAARRKQHVNESTSPSTSIGQHRHLAAAPPADEFDF